MWDKTKAFVSEHPWGTAAIVFVVGLLFIWLFMRRGGSTTSVDNLSPYYGAQAAAVDAGAAVYAAQIQANASTANHVTDAQTAVTLGAQLADVHNQETAAALEIGRQQIDATRVGTQQAILGGIITSPTGYLQTQQAPATLGILAARLWGALSGATNDNGNTGYPSNWFTGQPGATATPFNTPTSALVASPSGGVAVPTQIVSPTLPLFGKAA